MKKHFDTVLNARGEPILGAAVTVYLTGTNTKATLYADAAGAQTKANPTTTDEDGMFSFYVADGRYDIQIAGNGFATRVVSDVSISESGSGGGFADPGTVSVVSLASDFVLPASKGGTGATSLSELVGLAHAIVSIASFRLADHLTYQDGTWTPRLQFDTTVQINTSSSGFFSRVGNLVLFNAALVVGTKTGSGEFATYIGGFPFRPRVRQEQMSIRVENNGGSPVGFICTPTDAVPIAGASDFGFFVEQFSGSNSSPQPVPASLINAGAVIFVSGSVILNEE